ncbi:diguanylate cyclase [Cellvibrio sp. PSBB023]|uniref:diguanylate cyclase n=1 Tax=Cellvibrio sp. PSBB023 TaxID=1945512 RepID=UPI00098FCDD1|nr:diguanylate cyclase [Cellvibrio sp. PSBB023]AQT61515.1 diguanylate cyclase [Cellvibrio sp. PSBB023]
MDKKAEITARLDALRADYAARLPAEIARLRELVALALVPESQSSALVELAQKLHKLAGSAGSFGFPELGKKAKKLELQVQEWLASSNVDTGMLRVFSVAIAALGGESQSAKNGGYPMPSASASGAASSLIYVLEDDPDVANEVCMTLRHFGHQVEHFATIAAAEAEILRRPPDFMICDIMFSDEGRETPDAIAQLQAQLPSAIPVIFVSTRTDFAAYHAAVRAGAVGYFVKPLDIIRLVDCFENYLDRNRSTPYRVLIIDDDQSLAEHYKLVLGSADIRAEVISDPRDIFTLLNDFHPELILLDINMPGCSGIELAQVIRLNQDWLRVPITYLSSEQDEEKRALAMGRAGDDFLSKPLSDLELITAVSVRAARSRQLSDALDRDSLTGLLKHSRIKEQVDIELSRAQRTGDKLSVVMVDLDHFKQINDSYGHPAGDKVIKAMAHLLRQRLRKMDAVGRYGGEEFVAVLPRCSRAEAQALMEDIRKRFRDISFTVDQKTFHVTLSAGIAAFEPDIERADQLLQEADAALYRAKSDGRNRVCSLRG